jgi:hypothetical protein
MLWRLPIGTGAVPDSQYAGNAALWKARAAS